MDRVWIWTLLLCGVPDALPGSNECHLECSRRGRLRTRMVTMISTTEENKVAGKHLQRFKQVAGSLETLISSMAQDWEKAARDDADEKDNQDNNTAVYGYMRRAQLLFSELHAATRKTHASIEGFRYGNALPMLALAVCYTSIPTQHPLCAR